MSISEDGQVSEREELGREKDDTGYQKRRSKDGSRYQQKICLNCAIL